MGYPLEPATGAMAARDATTGAAAHATSAHTVRPQASPQTPQLSDKARTMISPRPESLMWSSAIRGPLGAPPSVTSIRATAPRWVTSTVNQPPRPL